MEASIGPRERAAYAGRMAHSDRAAGLSAAMVRDLATFEGVPLLSLYLRTDPRLPANTNHTPGWEIELRNLLKGVAEGLDQSGPREQRLAFRGLRDRIEEEVLSLSPGERARGIAWFRSADGAVDHRLSLQIPPREDRAAWGDRPLVAPLADVADRGRAAGLVLVSSEAVRLLHWELGAVSEPDRSLYELELGDWRMYEAYASANPARGQQTATNVEAYHDRVDDWRHRFLRDAARAIANRLEGLGWGRVVLICDERVEPQFTAEMPEEVHRRLVATLTANLLWEPPSTVGAYVEDELHRVWRREGRALAERALAAAAAGGAGARGWTETMDSLAQGRVEHLVLDPAVAPAPGALPQPVLTAAGDPAPALMGERAVELAAASGAAVTALAPEEADSLAEANGIAATLRY